ncbi:MAG: ATP-binding protein [Thermoprotei archaeon]|nr:MAG: ATP-binding protein [Thermoprotei archaeon]
MPREAVVEAYGLSKTFGNVKAVDGVSYSVRRGEIFGILGPNGAGKTTTIRITIGIIPPDKGEAYILGYNVHREPVKARSFIGVVPEISNPYPDLTVWDNLMLVGKLYCIPKRIRVEQAVKLLEALRIQGVYNRKAKALSKGMRRRLLLAMALISDPDILFLDEPTSGLDVISARIIRSLLLELKKQGKTIVLTTHNINEAGMLCDRIAIMNKGKIIASGTPEELKIRIGKYIRILLRFNKEVGVDAIKDRLKDSKVVVQGARITIICRLSDLEEVLSEIVDFIKSRNLRVEEFQASGPTLEDVFVELIQGGA